MNGRTASARLLVVEDDPKISRILELQLRHAGYEVTLVHDGGAALAVFSGGRFDLVILDVMLPGMNGFEVCRRIRERSSVPVIMLTAKSDLSDKVIGLDFGADDYVTKPFEMDELLARVRARVRNKWPGANSQVLRVEDLEVNPATYEVRRQGRPIFLSKTEFDLLALLVRNRGIVLRRESILEEVWGYDFSGNDNVLDVYIKYVRDKVDKPFAKQLIKTVRGVGYVIR